MTENKKIETWIKRHQEFNEEILSDSNINKELGSELGGNFENYLASVDLEKDEIELEVKRTLTKAIKNILERERERAEKKLTGEIVWGAGESDCPEHHAWIARLKDKLAELEEIKIFPFGYGNEKYGYGDTGELTIPTLLSAKVIERKNLLGNPVEIHRRGDFYFAYYIIEPITVEHDGKPVKITNIAIKFLSASNRLIITEIPNFLQQSNEEVEKLIEDEDLGKIKDNLLTNGTEFQIKLISQQSDSDKYYSFAKLKDENFYLEIADNYVLIVNGQEFEFSDMAVSSIKNLSKNIKTRLSKAKKLAIDIEPYFEKLKYQFDLVKSKFSLEEQAEIEEEITSITSQIEVLKNSQKQTLTITIKKIGADGHPKEKWGDSSGNYAVYEIEPTNFALTKNGITKNTTIKKIILRYEAINRGEVVGEISNFVEKKISPKTGRRSTSEEFILVDSLLKIDTDAQIKFASEHGHLLGADNDTLKITKNYTLTIANQEHQFVHDNLLTLTDFFALAKNVWDSILITLTYDGERKPEDISTEKFKNMKEKIDRIDRAIEEGEIATEEQKNLLAAWKKQLWVKFIAKKLSKIAEENEREKWTNFLNGLATNPCYILAKKEADIDFLGSIFYWQKYGGYQPEDIKKLQKNDKNKWEFSYQPASDAEVFSSTEWYSKKNIDIYWQLKKDLDKLDWSFLNSNEGISDFRRLRENLKQIKMRGGDDNDFSRVNNKEDVLKVIKKELCFITFDFITFEELFDERIGKIKDIISKEQAIAQRTDGAKWSLEMKPKVIEIFYHADLAHFNPNQRKEVADLLTNIDKLENLIKWKGERLTTETIELAQTIIAEIEANSNDWPTIVQEKTDNFIANRMVIIAEYLAFYNTERVNEKNIGTFYDFYNSWSSEVKNDGGEPKKQLLFDIHGADWENIGNENAFTYEAERIKATKKLSEWKEKLTNSSWLDTETELKNVKNELEKYSKGKWIWAADKLGIEALTIKNLWRKCKIWRKSIALIEVDLYNANDYLTMDYLMSELEFHPDSSTYSKEKKEEFQKKSCELKLDWLFKQAENETDLTKLEEIVKKIKVFQTERNTLKTAVWKEKNKKDGNLFNIFGFINNPGSLDKKLKSIEEKIDNLNAVKRSGIYEKLNWEDLDLTKISDCLKRIKDFIPSETDPDESLNNKELSPLQKTVWEANKSSLEKHYLVLKKCEFLGENTNLNSWEKEKIKSPTTENLELLNEWKAKINRMKEILPDNELRETWEKELIGKAKIDLDTIVLLVDKNWDEYLTSETLLKDAVKKNFVIEIDGKEINCRENKYPSTKQKVADKSDGSLTSSEKSSSADNELDVLPPLPPTPASNIPERIYLNPSSSAESINVEGVEETSEEWNAFFNNQNITEKAEKEAWMETGLTAIEAQTACDNGWKDKVASIKEKMINLIQENNGEEYTRIPDIEVLKVNKNELNKAVLLRYNLEKATSSDDLDNIWNESPDLNDDWLPIGWKEDDLSKVYEEKKNELTWQEFQHYFKAQGDSAADQTEEVIKRYFDYNYEIEEKFWYLSGTQCGQMFNNGWIDLTEVFLVITETNEIEPRVKIGEEEVNPLTTLCTTIDDEVDIPIGTPTEVYQVPTISIPVPEIVSPRTANDDEEEEIWIASFKTSLTDPCSLTDEEIIEWKKRNISPDMAAKIWKNGWEPSELERIQALNILGGSSSTHSFLVPKYTSYGETDIYLYSEAIKKSELDKVNRIIQQIKDAQQITDLPSADTINSQYNETQVPVAKNYDGIIRKVNYKKKFIETIEIINNELDADQDMPEQRTKKLYTLRLIFTDFHSAPINSLYGEVWKYQPTDTDISLGEQISNKIDDLQKAVNLDTNRVTAISAIEELWNQFKDENNLVNGKDQNTLLGVNWKIDLEALTELSEITASKTNLINLINQEILIPVRIAAITAVKNHWTSLNIEKTLEDIAGTNWKNNFDNLQETEFIKQEENRLKTLISQVKVQSDIDEIVSELNNKPVVLANELAENYQTVMIELASKETERKERKDELINEIKQIREEKLQQVRTIIVQAQEILAQNDATYETVQTTINNLESLANADSEKAEKIVWEENKEVNQKLLTDLLTKLATITPPRPEEEPSNLTEKYGEDYSALQPEQQRCRQTVCQNWNKSEKDYSHYRLYICHYCPQEFAYDANLEFLSAKKKAESELTNHQNNCPQKNETEQAKQIKQTKWKEIRKSKEGFFYTCQNCWGKIRLDKAINDYPQAKKQGLADFAYHQEQECTKPQAEKTIAIYFSPNQGGTQHAPLKYADKAGNPPLEKDNQDQVYQKENSSQTNVNQKWTTGQIVGLGVVLLTGSALITLLIMKLVDNWLAKKKNKVS